MTPGTRVYRNLNRIGGSLYIAIEPDGRLWTSDHKGPWVSTGYGKPPEHGYELVNVVVAPC